MYKNLGVISLIIVLVLSLAIGIYGVNEGLEGNSDSSIITKPEEKKKYNADNLDVEYHDKAEEIGEQKDEFGLSTSMTWVIDPSGNKVAIPYTGVQGNVTYYEPGTYTYGASTYVPSYEDSVYLSKTTNLYYMAKVKDTSSMMAGICNQYKNSPDKLEQACNAIDKNVCGSTNCCLLLGGAKCVSGNESGPHLKSNYSDILIRNKDYYYYQGKCYGNCPPY
jgi:hypothetical protein